MSVMVVVIGVAGLFITGDIVVTEYRRRRPLRSYFARR